jgi:SAM-dependent methyltransferase
MGERSTRTPQFWQYRNVNDFDDASRARWAGKAAAFERSFSALCGYTAGDLLDAVGPIDGRSLLDVGTGTGTVAALAVERGARVVGVDPDADMLQIARSKVTGALLSIDALPDLRWHDDSFDAVVANFVVNHVGDPRAAVRELARVARPGSRVAITVWPHPKSPVYAVLDQMVVECGFTIDESNRLPEDKDFERSEDGVAGILIDGGLVDVTASRISWVHRTTFDDLWFGVSSGIGGHGVGELVASQPPDVVANMQATLGLLVELYRDGDVLALPAEALLASGTRAAAS